MTLTGIVHCDGPGCDLHSHIGADTMRDLRPAAWHFLRYLSDLHPGLDPEREVWVIEFEPIGDWDASRIIELRQLVAAQDGG